MNSNSQGAVFRHVSHKPPIKIFAWILLGAVCAALALGPAPAESQERFQEFQVKAAFLFHFSKFVEWPRESFPEKNSPLILAVLGKDPFGEALDSLGGKSVGNREIQIKRFADPDRLERCHILFVRLPEKEQWQRVLKTAASWNVLTVSDENGFAQAGGGIRFFIEEHKVRFEINPDAVSRQGLRISSQLLKLAKIVREH